MLLKVVDGMKKFIITKCMNYIKKNTNYNDIKLKEIEYGLVSIYLTLTKIILILILAIIFGIFREVLLFMMFFNILRTTGFGLHATKSWICLLSSTLIFIGIPILCEYIQINTYVKLLICILSIIFMLKNAPADTKKKPIINKKRRLILKLISTILAIIFSICALIIKNEFLSNCLIFALILENTLIAPFTYKLFKLPHNNYITYLKEHPEVSK